MDQTGCTLRLTNFDVSRRFGKPMARYPGPAPGMPVQSDEAEKLADQVCVISVLEPN